MDYILYFVLIIILKNIFRFWSKLELRYYNNRKISYSPDDVDKIYFKAQNLRIANVVFVSDDGI